jgi:hypothetical protein
MDSLWSLSEQLATISSSRLFSPPLASGVPQDNKQVGDLSDQAVDSARYTVSDVPFAPPPTPTPTRVFSVVVSSGSGFTPEPNFPTLPDPSIRLHAIATALVRFRPADNALVLETFIFGSLSSQQVPWWQRWIDAGRIPKTIAYINVDVDDLKARLQATTSKDVMPGLSIPSLTDDSGADVPLDAGQIQRFADGFFAGMDAQFALVAKAGAVLGQAGLGSGGPNRELRLEVRYSDDSASSPQPMNPRELLYLLYGNTSKTATTHPLLQALDKSAPPSPRNTRQLILRPPLRTWQRVMWEAGLEATYRSAEWADAGLLANDTLFNTLRRENVAGSGQFDPLSYTLGDLVGESKCNLFVGDIAIRAGFKSGIHHLDLPVWHYLNANSYANLGRIAQVNAGQPVTPAPLPVAGTAATDDPGPWAVTYGQMVTAGMTPDQMNALVKQDGRCLIVAMMRGRRFQTDNHGHVTAASCTASLKAKPSGHIVFVREVAAGTPGHPNPSLVAPVDPGFTVPPFVNPRVINVMQLSSAGAFSTGADDNHNTFNPALGGRAGRNDSSLAGVRIQLMELRPGGDPDTTQGLATLNVRQTDRTKLNTTDEAAKTRRRPAGPGSPCCFDAFPPGTITEAACPANVPA